MSTNVSLSTNRKQVMVDTCMLLTGFGSGGWYSWGACIQDKCSIFGAEPETGRLHQPETTINMTLDFNMNSVVTVSHMV